MNKFTVLVTVKLKADPGEVNIWRKYVQCEINLKV